MVIVLLVEPLEVLIKRKDYEQRMLKHEVSHKLLHVHDFATSTNLANSVTAIKLTGYRRNKICES